MSSVNTEVNRTLECANIEKKRERERRDVRHKTQRILAGDEVRRASLCIRRLATAIKHFHDATRCKIYQAES